LRDPKPGLFARGRKLRSLLLLAPALTLGAQTPDGWNHREALGADLPATSWFGVGVWEANQHGLPATLIDSLGMGNGYVGAGVSAQAGFNGESWSVAILGMADSDAQGRSHFTVMQSHALYRSPGGWVMGFDQEPLVWGYGLTGGYLLGEADRPIPKLKLESPLAQRALFGVPMGQWAWSAFLGRLENGRALPDSSQMPLGQQAVINANGDPQAPLLSGYRVEARFLDQKLETYANLTVLWGGTTDGVAMTKGYGLGDYLTAITGAKDPLAENKARSSGNFDMGFRLKLPALAGWLDADQAWFYVSRGSKGMTVNWAQVAHSPASDLGSDLSADSRSLVGMRLKQFWDRNNRYYAPNLLVPNDTIGVMARWPAIRLALEYQNTVNPLNYYRSFANNVYPTGFYHYGDPLGEATGGEARINTLRLETDPSAHLTTTTWIQNGNRPFRDDPSLWSAANPGLTPEQGHFRGVQQAVAWKFSPRGTLNFRGGWMRQTAYQNIPGNDGNGFRWALDLTFRFPGQLR
jgi:hypothetical protein